MEEREDQRVQFKVQEVPELPIEDAGNFQIQRVDKGKFKKGVSANPSGKPKGASTEKTERLKMLMDGALSEMWPKYGHFAKSGREEFANEYRALMEFRMPKLARIDGTTVNIDAKEQQTIKIGDTELIIN